MGMGPARRAVLLTRIYVAKTASPPEKSVQQQRRTSARSVSRRKFPHSNARRLKGSPGQSKKPPGARSDAKQHHGEPTKKNPPPGAYGTVVSALTRPVVCGSRRSSAAVRAQTVS